MVQVKRTPSIIALCESFLQENLTPAQAVAWVDKITRKICSSSNETKTLRAVGDYFADIGASLFLPEIISNLGHTILHHPSVNSSQMLYLKFLALYSAHPDIEHCLAQMEVLREMLAYFIPASNHSYDALSLQQTKSLLNLEMPMRVTDIICKDGPLDIYYFDYSHPANNSFSIPSNRVVLNLRSNKHLIEDHNAPYIFLHELGHVFAYTMTKTQIAVPSSFGHVINQAFKPNIPKAELAEVYADCFAVACVNGTEFEHLVPFYNIFRRNDIDFMSQYFRNELANQTN